MALYNEYGINKRKHSIPLGKKIIDKRGLSTRVIYIFFLLKRARMIWNKFDVLNYTIESRLKLKYSWNVQRGKNYRKCWKI